MPGEVREKCAVAGVLAADPEVNTVPVLFEALHSMQHRGPEGSGMAVDSSTAHELHAHRGSGMVHDVFNEEVLGELKGNYGVGQNRYSTSGNKRICDTPHTEEAIGLGFTHNGTIANTAPLDKYLSRQHIRHARANDTQKASLAIAQLMRRGSSLPDAVEKAYPLLTGSFSCVAMHDDMLVAFRDPAGIRPLAVGQFDGGYAITSETCGLDTIGADYLREVQPGEMLIITKDGIEPKQIVEGQDKLDMFEYVYFARHDSYLYGQRVNQVRRRLGERLAVEHPRSRGLNDTIVVPVPDTSVPAAEGYADLMGLRHSQALIKNRYIGRTFLEPFQTDRKTQLRRKHNLISEIVENKHVVLIEDSIVRFNTIPRLVELAYSAGARSVSVLIASPPVRFPDFYGIDTPRQSELAAANLTIKQMEDRLSDGNRRTYLGYLSLAGMIEAVGLSEDMFNLSCFNGVYPIDIGKHKQEIKKPISMQFAA